MSKLKNIRSGLILRKFDKKGVALFMVLATILIVIVLANIVLTIISSQSRLTHHKVSRVQAYYAAQAAINYAMYKLKIGPPPTGWSVGVSCLPTSGDGGCDLPADSNFPASIIQPVKIFIRPAGSAGCTNSPGSTACVSATAIYTYTSP